MRQYNKSYNYFNGMSDEDVARYQEASVTGHRPTWSMGKGERCGRRGWRSARVHAWLLGRRRVRLFRSRHRGRKAARIHRCARPVRKVERKCLTALDLDETAAPAIQIKRPASRTLVKRHHPDSNGGNRASEDKLREVIQAYNYLKQAGLC